MATTFRGRVIDDLTALDLRRTEFLAGRIIEAIVEEGMRRGWALKVEDKEIAEGVHLYCQDRNLDEMLVEAGQKEREAGGAALFPVLDGAQGDLSTPLDEGSISTVHAFHLLEPRELLPIAWETDLTKPGWRLPSMYQLVPLSTGTGITGLAGVAIHASRLIVFPGRRFTPQPQFGQRTGWGDSALSPVWTVLSDFGISWASAATLLQQHGKETLELDGFAQMMSSKDGEAEFGRWLDAMQQAWSVLRMNVIDRKSTISRSTGTLAGVHELLGEFKALVAAAAETPVPILMGRDGTGLNAGDEDTRTWYSSCEKYRGKRMAPRHRQAIRICMLAADSPTQGEIPDLWSIEYHPLFAPTEKEVAETRKTDAERAAILISNGITSVDDVAESFFGGDTYSPDIVIDWERRRAQAEVDVAQAEQDPGALDALGGGEDPEPSDDELDDLADEDEEDVTLDDEEGDDEEGEEEGTGDREDAWREDKGAVSGGRTVVRASDGRFGRVAGIHNGPKRPVGAPRAAATPKFNAEPHKAAIAGHKATELHHRQQSLRIKAEMVAIRDGAKGGSKADRAAARTKLAALRAQRAEHQGKAGEARTARIAASKGMTAARTEHTAAAREARSKAKAAKDAAKAERSKVKGEKSKVKGEKSKTKVEKAKAQPTPSAPPAKATPPTPSSQTPQHQAETRSAVVAAPPRSVAEIGRDARNAAMDAKDSAKDTDFAGARQHIDTAKQHYEAIVAHEAKHGRTSESLQALDETKRAISSAESHVRFAEGDQKLSHLRRQAPQGLAMKAGEYRAMAEAYPEKLSGPQKLAVMNYTDHTDKILNPMLRQAGGHPDPSAMLYQGAHVPDHVHAERLAKRRSRMSEEHDKDLSVATEISRLDSAIAANRLPRDVTTYRVMNDPTGNLIKSLKPGDVFQDHGYVSTTADKNILDGFHSGNRAHRVDMHVTIRKGTPAAPMHELSSFKNEAEILLGRGSKFRITKIEPAVAGADGTKGTAMQVHMEVI